jgi:hypothetical protein
MATAFEARTVELISVDVFVYDMKVGVLGDHGQGQIEAMVISRQFRPLGLITTARAAIAALVAATMRLPREANDPGAAAPGSFIETHTKSLAVKAVCRA